MRKNKVILTISLLLFSIYFIIQGLKQQFVIAKLGYFLCSIGFFVGSLGYIYEVLKKNKAKN